VNIATVLPSKSRSSLKEPAGWFAAGQSFGQALALLSDGAFKLFAYLCLQADRRTGRFAASQKELAVALGKSKRVIGRYVVELEARGICIISPARNQYARTRFAICDAFWPYQRMEQPEDPPGLRQYVESVRETFVGLGCTSGNFGAAETATAKHLYQRRIPLAVVNDAMLMAACRKYSSWVNGMVSEPIQSLRYFEQVIAEIQSQPLPPGYSAYLRRKVKESAEAWLSSGKESTCPAVGLTATSSMRGSDHV
jgi:hypothetical protein